MGRNVVVWLAFVLVTLVVMWLLMSAARRRREETRADAEARRDIVGGADGGMPETNPTVSQRLDEQPPTDGNSASSKSDAADGVEALEEAGDFWGQPDVEVSSDAFEDDARALAGAPEVDAAERQYHDAESDAAAGDADRPVEPEAVKVPAVVVPVPAEEVVAELESDAAALAGTPEVDESQARFQAALDEMVAERDALAAGKPVKEVVTDAVDTDAVATEAVAARPRHRWVSEYDEVVDGGYGWGSAAPVSDGAMPLGHPIKANREWMKYQEPDDQWYDQIATDVWFLDSATAERLGFHKD
ncbi:MAG: hypothetical protein WAR57_12435 [Candidatus Phosphoribacter sp.]